VAANLDGDSDIDLAVAGIEGLGRVLQNNGSGQFPSFVDFKCASNAVDIAAGNLNAGGTADLAVASSLRDVDLLLNNGNATFGVDQTVPANVAPRGIASAHLNADTSVDIAITDEFNGRVQVMLGNGSGGFGVPANYATGGATLALVLADFNLDGKLDIATANFGVGPNVAILLGNGSGGFGAPTMYQAGAYASALATSDINGDGWPDLVVASFGDNNFTVFRNDFGILVSEGTHSTMLAAAGIAFGNFNSDTDPDVVVTNNGDASITIYHGDVGADFSFSANLTVPAAPMGVLAKDFDGNGFSDIAVTSSEQQALTVLMNGSGSGIFSFTTYTVGPAWSVIAVDEDQNGTTDLLVPESQNNCVSILHGGTGGPAFFGYPDIILGTGHFPMGVAEGQVYFSGGVAQGFDILTTNNGGGDISVLPFQPSPPPPAPNAPTVSAPVSADLEDGGSLTFTVSAFDIDGDAIASLTASNLPSGATFTPGVGNTTGTFTWVPPSPIQPGDFVVTFTASNALSGSKQTTIHLKPGGTDATGKLLWTPKASDIGAHVVKFRAVNEYGERDSATTTITVTSRLAPPMPSARTMGAPESPTKGPVISVVPTATISEGSTLDLSVSATDTDSLSATTTDLSADNTATFSANGSPIVTCPTDVNAPTGVALTINVSATDPDNDAITSLTASTTGLPPGNDATFTPNGQNTQGTFTWTPTASDIGTYGVTFTAVNALVGTAGTIIHVGGALAGYWKLNGNGLDATQHTNVVPVSGEVYAAGRLGQGLQLNGTTSVGLRGTATASHDGSAPFTVECWVNAGALTSIKQTFLEAELNETPAYWAFSVQGNTGRAMVEVRTGVTTAVVVSTVPITGGLFHHVALTYDGALLRLYLNGTLNTSTAFSAAVVVNLGSLNVGGGGSTFPAGLQSGVVDEVRIWREVRSQTQIQATMNQELNGYATGVETTGPVFRDALFQNAPNPFNPSTEIVFEVAQAGRATLRVYDVAGRLVSTLVDADVPAGPVRVRWAGRDAQGRRVRSGVYFYKLEIGRFRSARQMVLIQ
jgi:hypothetical protein